MRSVKLLLPLLGLILVSQSVSGYFYEHFVTQKLLPIDQFETRTWQNNYYLDDSYYTPGGPMFISAGASTAYSDDGWMNYTLFYDIGKEMNALLVYSQHRFFGSNHPTRDVSVANLQFLDSRYAVDDVANLVTQLKEQYQTGAVLVHGFDHGGAIATWLAHRHPQLVDGLWASSATLNAVKDHSTYLTNLAEDIRVIGGQECYRNTELAFERMESLYASGNYQELEAVFNVCSSFTPGDDNEAFAFFYTHAIALGSLIRYSHRIGVEGLCGYYSMHEDPMQALASFVQLVLPDCIPLSSGGQLEDFFSTSWDSPTHVSGVRQGMYQNCREFGWYVSSNGPDHPFGNRFPLEVFQHQCQNVFGAVFTESNMNTFFDQTNRIFGGNRPNVTNAYFTVGEYDPSKDLGVLEVYKDNVFVDIISDYGAGAEILSAGVYDTPQIIAVQARVRELLTRWIAEASRK